MIIRGLPITVAVDENRDGRDKQKEKTTTSQRRITFRVLTKHRRLREAPIVHGRHRVQSVARRNTGALRIYI